MDGWCSETHLPFKLSEILPAIGLSSSRWQSLKRAVSQRQARESIIPEEELVEAVQQIIAHPTVGSAKGALKLVEDHKSILSSTFYCELKSMLEEQAQQQFHSRKEKSEVAENYRDRQEIGEPFEKVAPTEPHQVWATDFTEIQILGVKFIICVVYEVFSGAYLAIKSDISGGAQLAKDTLREALQYAGCQPQHCLLSDNGKEFLSEAFGGVLKDLKIEHRYTPPGQPWYNGALESGNKDLKKLIYTAIAQKIAQNPSSGRKNAPVDLISLLLKTACKKVKKQVNGQLPRLNHGTTPENVIDNKKVEAQNAQLEFRRKQQEKRRRRMEDIKAGKKKPRRKTFADKAKHVIKKQLKALNIEQVYSLWQLLRGNYSIVTA